MSTLKETICDVYWQGPFNWKQKNAVARKQHSLYAIYGTHRVYGPWSLLYIGRTASFGGKRLNDHNWWVEEESEHVRLYLGSIGEFENWQIWDSIEKYGDQELNLVKAIEKLLIHAHQPAYNSSELVELKKFYNIRVFNSGKYATLLPECSYRYYRDP
jgi:hypothetical protein